MSSKANVTTPGGFFVGLGGIVSFCVVAAAVWWWVKSPSSNTELRPQQIALGLRAPDDAKGDDAKKKAADTDALLKAAAKKYNGGAQPNLDKLDDLRGVIRFRESEKALIGAVAWKDKAKGDVTMPIELAMKAVANNLKDRKPKVSAVKVDALPVLDPNAAPMMPNAMGGGAKTVIFADPNAPAAPAPAAPVPATPAPAPAAPAAPAPEPTAPAPAPAAPAATPAAPANPAPAPGGASAAAPAPTIASIPAPARPALLNWPESTK
jgi:hypothetical protein